MRDLGAAINKRMNDGGGGPERCRKGDRDRDTTGSRVMSLRPVRGWEGECDYRRAKRG